jgi:hypothetical protein
MTLSQETLQIPKNTQKTLTKTKKIGVAYPQEDFLFTILHSDS